MKQLVTATLAAAVLTVWAGVAAADGHRDGSRRVVERTTVRSCDGENCGMRISRRGEGVRHRFRDSHAVRPDRRPSQFWPGRRQAKKHAYGPRHRAWRKHKRRQVWRHNQRRHAWRHNKRRHAWRMKNRRHHMQNWRDHRGPRFRRGH